jgi:malic enzyme
MAASSMKVQEKSVRLGMLVAFGICSGCTLPGNLAYNLGLGEEKFLSCDEKGLNCKAVTTKEFLAERDAENAESEHKRQEALRRKHEEDERIATVYETD